MKVIWSVNAQKQLNDIAYYIQEEFSRNRKLKFLREVKDNEKLISTHPFVGKIEPLLIDRSISYRSFVINNVNKIVYYVEDKRIVIVAFWDARQEPQKLVNQIN
ncbi:MAG: type II toxin-antitoxin system RelE/ParE family toxin [Bacteroidales bacterium]|jgi:plasmid stabilization system protein ParE|nr:type II toxin-antitoxin system RelE/ParE family toxin [Bacteroidales bacterium]MBR6279578.1 type II toxin-antitoxin system RelE/ParE family toxin [Bacteroidales bacterium]